MTEAQLAHLINSYLWGWIVAGFVILAFTWGADLLSAWRYRRDKNTIQKGLIAMFKEFYGGKNQ